MTCYNFSLHYITFTYYQLTIVLAFVHWRCFNALCTGHLHFSSFAATVKKLKTNSITAVIKFVFFTVLTCLSRLKLKLTRHSRLVCESAVAKCTIPQDGITRDTMYCLPIVLSNLNFKFNANFPLNQLTVCSHYKPSTAFLRLITLLVEITRFW